MMWSLLPVLAWPTTFSLPRYAEKGITLSVNTLHLGRYT